MEKITAPFTEDQIKKLNEYQESGRFHPFTCCSPDEISECLRKKDSDGILIANTDGWVCSCGKYKQNWAFLSVTK